MATSSLIFENRPFAGSPLYPEDLDLFFRLNGDEQVMGYIRPVQTANRWEFLQKITMGLCLSARPWPVGSGNETGELWFFCHHSRGTRKILAAGLCVAAATGDRVCYGISQGRFAVCFDVLKMEDRRDYLPGTAIPKVLFNNGLYLTALIPEDGRQLHLYFVGLNSQRRSRYRLYSSVTDPWVRRIRILLASRN